MKNRLFLLVSLLTISFLTKAQFDYQYPPKTQTNYDIALAFGSKAVSPSISFSKLYSVTKNKRFKIGYGVRLNTYFGQGKSFVTAPASIASEAPSLGALFTLPVVKNLDTLVLNSAAVASLNAKIVLQYSIKKVDIGFNIDALGFTVGGQQSGTFFASSAKAFNKKMYTAKPTTTNLLLISNSDRGSLNSELYARYWLNDNFAIRAGASFQFVEYTTSQKLTFDNDRFRLKTLIPFVALTFSPSKLVYKDLKK